MTDIEVLSISYHSEDRPNTLTKPTELAALFLHRLYDVRFCLTSYYTFYTPPLNLSQDRPTKPSGLDKEAHCLYSQTFWNLWDSPRFCPCIHGGLSDMFSHHEKINAHYFSY